MQKIRSRKRAKQEEFRYSQMPGGGLSPYIFVSLVKGIVWLVKTPIKWTIKKVKSKQ